MRDYRRTRFVLVVFFVAFSGLEVAGQKPENDTLERLKLQQERELKEKELALRERELEMQRRQNDWNRWSNPAMVAVIGGLLGYFGTLLSSRENRKIERQKQDSLIMLEAIKTAGSPAEKEKQAAANLVFFADAGLITSISADELGKLRLKAEGALPSLPSPIPLGVEFRRSPILTEARQSKLQTALAQYQAYLSGIGFKPGHPAEKLVVRIDEDNRNNAFFDNTSVVIGAALADDPEFILAEYTWQVLKETNSAAFAFFWDLPLIQPIGFLQGLKEYLPASYLNDPKIGRNYYALTNTPKIGPLFELDRFKPYEKGREYAPHEVAEMWAAGLWDLRATVGQEAADRLALNAWKQFQPNTKQLTRSDTFVEALVNAREAAGISDIDTIREPFKRRHLYSEGRSPRHKE